MASFRMLGWGLLLAAAQEVDLESRVARLVAALEEDDPSVRERAVAESLRLGEAAAPGLERVLVKGSPDARARAKELLERIRKEALRRKLGLTISTDRPAYPEDTYLGNMRVSCTLRNGSSQRVVLLRKEIHLPDCTGYPANLTWPELDGLVLRAAGPPRYSCFGEHLHPLTREHFLVLEPGESLEWKDGPELVLPMIRSLSEIAGSGFEKARERFTDGRGDRLKPGTHRLKLRYALKKIALEDRYFPDAEIRALWERAQEVELESNEAEFRIGAP
jgi:hypothetical protein